MKTDSQTKYEPAVVYQDNDSVIRVRTNNAYTDDEGVLEAHPVVIIERFSRIPAAHYAKVIVPASHAKRLAAELMRVHEGWEGRG